MCLLVRIYCQDLRMSDTTPSHPSLQDIVVQGKQSFENLFVKFNSHIKWQGVQKKSFKGFKRLHLIRSHTEKNKTPKLEWMSIEKLSVSKFSPALRSMAGNGWPITDFTPYMPDISGVAVSTSVGIHCRSSSKLATSPFNERRNGSKFKLVTTQNTSYVHFGANFLGLRATYLDIFGIANCVCLLGECIEIRFPYIFTDGSERQSCRQVPCFFPKGWWNHRAISSASDTEVRGLSQTEISTVYFCTSFITMIISSCIDNILFVTASVRQWL